MLKERTVKIVRRTAANCVTPPAHLITATASVNPATQELDASIRVKLLFKNEFHYE